MHFLVDYLGCEKRKLDTQRIIDYIKLNEWKQTSKSSEADYIIFVTCGFRRRYELWSINKIQKLLKTRKSTSKVIISGCLPKINPDALMELGKDLILIGPRELDNLDQILNPKIPFKAVADPNLTVFETRNRNQDNSDEFHTSARDEYENAKTGFKVRINWGCLGNCAYCVIRLATGILQSKSLVDVKQELNLAQQNKTRDIFFTGGDTGAYGQDLNSNIVDFFKLIFDKSYSFKAHFHDFGIQWFIRYQDELLPLLKDNPDRVGTISLPIQSGSDKILKLMNRNYLRDDILHLLPRLKEEVPSLKIGTHFIIGFPGETDADFGLTLDLFQHIPIDFLNVFRYTDHGKSLSFSFENKVPDKIITKRYIEFADLFKHLRKK